jgi:phosphomannomutase
MLAALHALAALGHDDRPLSVILSDFSRYRDSGEINSEVADQAAAIAKIKGTYAERTGVTLDELDGLTVSVDTWWFNVRPSNTEPLLRLNVEASDDAELAAVRDEVLGLIREDTAR